MGFYRAGKEREPRWRNASTRLSAAGPFDCSDTVGSRHPGAADLIALSAVSLFSLFLRFVRLRWFPSRRRSLLFFFSRDPATRKLVSREPRRFDRFRHDVMWENTIYYLIHYSVINHVNYFVASLNVLRSRYIDDLYYPVCLTIHFMENINAYYHSSNDVGYKK